MYMRRINLIMFKAPDHTQNKQEINYGNYYYQIYLIINQLLNTRN